jgi:aarF domain-containing kinase
MQFQHADLHPGNIMLCGFNQKDGKQNEKPRITLVDAGMVAQLTDDESSAFIGLLTCLGESDGEAAAEFALRFSIENNFGAKEKDAFKKDMQDLFAEKCRGYGTNIDVGEILRGVLGLIRDHRIRIDATFATLVINILCVESLGKRACPSYNVLDASRPLLQAYRKLCYQDDGFTPKSKNQKVSTQST